MKNINRYFCKITTVCLFLLGFLASCKKEEAVDPNMLEKPQLIMYTPVSDSIGVTVRFVWNKVNAATSYQLELSSDSLLYTNELKTYTVNDTNSITIKGIASNTVFSARLKAFNSINSSRLHTSSLVPRENIFAGMTTIYGVVTYPGVVSDSLITASTVKLKWRRGKIVTGIAKTVNGVTDTLKVTMSSPTDTSRIITGLNSATHYSFNICNNKINRGKVTVITK